MAPKTRGAHSGKHKASTTRGTTSSGRVTRSKSARRAPPSPTPVDLSTKPSPVPSPASTTAPVAPLVAAPVTSPVAPPVATLVASLVAPPVAPPVASPVATPVISSGTMVIHPDSDNSEKRSKVQSETLKSDFGVVLCTRLPSPPPPIITEIDSPPPSEPAIDSQWTPWSRIRVHLHVKQETRSVLVLTSHPAFTDPGG